MKFNLKFLFVRQSLSSWHVLRLDGDGGSPVANLKGIETVDIEVGSIPRNWRRSHIDNIAVLVNNRNYCRILSPTLIESFKIGILKQEGLSWFIHLPLEVFFFCHDFEVPNTVLVSFLVVNVLFIPDGDLAAIYRDSR